MERDLLLFLRNFVSMRDRLRKGECIASAEYDEMRSRAVALINRLKSAPASQSPHPQQMG